MIDVDKTTFEEEVLKAEGYVFVDFYGDGCVPCQALMPKVHEFADTYGNKLKFTSLNTTKARRLAIAQKVLGLPVMAIYKDGEKVEELVKALNSGETLSAAQKATKGKASISSEFGLLKEHLATFFQSKVQLSCDEKGKGKITIPFKNEEDLVRIIALFDNLKK